MASAVVAVFAAVLGYGLIINALGAARIVTDRPAPAFSLPVLAAGQPGPRLAPRMARALEDRRLKLTELRGVPVMLNVWASWCPSCREEAPVLQRAWQRDLRPRGVLLLGLNVRDVPQDARAFLREFRIDSPTVRDAVGNVAERYGATSIPQMFLISRSGRVVARILGTLRRDDLRAQAQRVLVAR